VGGTGTFTVAPNTGLTATGGAAGTYTATVTVTGGNGITASFGVSFTVTAAPTYGAALSVNGTHAFLEDGVEYVEVEPLTVTITNTGNQATGGLLAALSGANAGSFALSTGSISSIAADGTGTFTVVPNTGLSKGTYTATVTVSGGNDIAPQSFGVSFTVGDIYTRAASMEAYLTKATGGTTVDDPVSLRVKIKAGDWAALRGAINAAGRFVALDLSPSFPGVSSIGSNAFQNCAKLASVSFPEATSIGESAFYNCTGLTSVSFPEVTSIGQSTFQYCIGLITVSFPEVISIGESAFYYCTSLTTATFSEATSIMVSAFHDCTSLASLSLPKAAYIGALVFSYTGGTALTITLGNAPPMVDYFIFPSSISVSKTVTVRVPSWT
jgi:hypothetical protein